ncbi:isochorismatase family protein [Lentzea sp. NPDC051208]|uniref:isochorismatase family protein n=1 Tax=Lentzea sp. NPDC051208 TaxID=3154642 RepID=UPI003420C8A1
MLNQPLTPENSAIVLIDHGVGFANLFRSHEVAAHVNNVVALAETAQAFEVPLIVTGGADDKPSGPLYGELAKAIGDHEVIVREGNFDAFRTTAFESAITATKRQNLVIAGLMTEGCVLQTALGALQRNYSVYLVTDASAGETAEAHQMAVLRMTQLGVVPVTWLSLATELQGSWNNLATVKAYTEILSRRSVSLAMGLHSHQAAFAAGARSASA